MKFLSWLGTILIILLIIAAITAPGDKKFENFIAKDKGGDTMSCKPVIGKQTQIKVLVKIATIQTVSYCESRMPLNIRDQNGELKPTNLSIPKITHTETYLGLFGKFWKI
jgi:hypothetical protein